MLADWITNYWYVPTIIVIIALFALGLYFYNRYQNKGRPKSPEEQEREESIKKLEQETGKKQELEEKLHEQQEVIRNLFAGFHYEEIDTLLSENKECLENLESGDYETIFNEYNRIYDEMERIKSQLEIYEESIPDINRQDPASSSIIEDLEENFMDRIINNFGWTEEELSEYYNSLETGIIKKSEAERNNETYGHDIIQQIYEILPNDFKLPNEQALKDWWYDDVLDPTERPDSNMTIDEWRKYVADQREFLIDIFKNNFGANNGQSASELNPSSHDQSSSFEEGMKALDNFISKSFDDLTQSKILSEQNLDLSKSFHGLLEELGIADMHGNVQQTEQKATIDIANLEQSQLKNQQQKIEQVEEVSNNPQTRELLAENQQSQQNLLNINNENPEQILKELVGNELQIQGLQQSTDQLEKQAGIPVDPTTTNILHEQEARVNQDQPNPDEKGTHKELKEPVE